MKFHLEMEKINKTYYFIAAIISLILPKKRMVYFSSFYGQYNDNPRHISETLHEKNQNIPIYWAKSPRNHSNFPQYIKTIDILSFKHYLYLFTAKVTVDNQIGLKTISVRNNTINRLFSKIVKFSCRNQLNIGTWHGTPLKNIGEKNLDFNNTTIRINTTNYSISGCTLTEECLLLSFPNAFKIKRYGTPRNDGLFKEQDIITIKRRLGLPLGKKILLFAPTFRENQDMSGINQLETIDWNKLIAVFKNKFGGEWVVAVRIHPHVMSALKIRYNDLLINGNNGDDMADYLIVSDALLTDYSSSFFDYALTKRPCFLYVPDLEKYRDQERGFYFDFNKLPFPKSYFPEQLISSIQSFDAEKYRTDIISFLKLIGNYEDGQASKRIVDDILTFIDKIKD